MFGTHLDTIQKHIRTMAFLEENLKNPTLNNLLDIFSRNDKEFTHRPYQYLDKTHDLLEEICTLINKSLEEVNLADYFTFKARTGATNSSDICVHYKDTHNSFMEVHLRSRYASFSRYMPITEASNNNLDIVVINRLKTLYQQRINDNEQGLRKMLIKNIGVSNMIKKDRQVLEYLNGLNFEYIETDVDVIELLTKLKELLFFLKELNFSINIIDFLKPTKVLHLVKISNSNLGISSPISYHNNSYHFNLLLKEDLQIKYMHYLDSGGQNYDYLVFEEVPFDKSGKIYIGFNEYIIDKDKGTVTMNGEIANVHELVPVLISEGYVDSILMSDIFDLEMFKYRSYAQQK